MLVFSTGKTGTIGSALPESVLPLRVRLELPLSAQLLSNQLNGNALIHLAGIVGSEKINVNPKSAEINVDKTVELAEHALRMGISKFIFASSSHVYAPSNEPVTENSETGPTTVYGIQKLEAEFALQEVFADQTEKLVIARIFSLLDFDMPDYSLGGVLSEILADKGEVQVKATEDVRDFLERKKVAQALVVLATSETKYLHYNICSGNALTVKEALSSFVRTQGGNLSATIFKRGHSSRPYLVGDNSRVKSEFPKLDLTWPYI